MANYNSDKNAATNLIVNYLPQTMSDKELFSMFVTIGPVESCRVMKDFKTGYSYGFGFVNYSKEEDASRAIAQLNGLEVSNKRIKVSYARPSGDDIKETNLYVTNLPRNITDEQLDSLFGSFGTIVQKNLLKDKLTGQPRGVAFIRYNLKSEANEAIRNMDGVTPDGGVEKLSVRIAEEHGKQKAAYYAGWQAGFNQNRGISISCYQCNSTDHVDPFQCGEYMTDDIDIEPKSCDNVYEAAYCIKHTGRFEGGIGTKRYCSSLDLGNYCNYISQPGDLLVYRSCVYTCSSDGCNTSHTLQVNKYSLIAGLIVIAYIFVQLS